MCAAACVWFCLSYNTSITYSPGAGACGAAQARKVGDDGHLHGNVPWRTTGTHNHEGRACEVHGNASFLLPSLEPRGHLLCAVVSTRARSVTS